MMDVSLTLSITEAGWKLFQKYDEHYFGELVFV